MSLLTNLEGYWKLDESSGNAVDSSGNGFTLTNNNSVTYDSGIINNGADFGSSNTSKTLTTSSLINTTAGGSKTINHWYNITTALASDDTLGMVTINYGTGGVRFGTRYERASSTNKVSAVYTKPAVGDTEVSDTVDVTTGTWFMITVTYDGSTMELFVNAVSKGTVSVSGGGVPISDQFCVGSILNSSNFFSGHVDELGTWSRVLSGSEITTLYNGGAGLQYPFITTSILKVSGVAQASILKVSKVTNANIKKVSGVTNQ